MLKAYRNLSVKLHNVHLQGYLHESCDVLYCRYSIVAKCWEEDSSKRLSFSEIVGVFSSFLGSLANYFDLDMS